MNKKYQVFVSSTYQDLVEERKEVIQALLELDCIPVGMELFPATDDEQWTLIKELIDDCDYYILIIGGRYGSLSKEGISYTQMEYEYAISIGIPVISFLHKNPESLSVSKTDKNPDKEIKLKSFRELAQQKLVKFWTSPEDLGSVVSRSLVKLIKTKPRIGWVKSNSISSTEANLEILSLRDKIQELEEKLKEKSNTSTLELAQGEDIINIAFNSSKGSKWEEKEISVTWNQFFSKTCTVLINEADEDEYLTMVNGYIRHISEKENNEILDEVIIFKDVFMSILIQFKALGLIEKGIKNRSIKDTKTYWKLTQKGDELLTNLRAIKKNDNKTV